MHYTWPNSSTAATLIGMLELTRNELSCFKDKKQSSQQLVLLIPTVMVACIMAVTIRWGKCRRSCQGKLVSGVVSVLFFYQSSHSGLKHTITEETPQPLALFDNPAV